jgi:hypothetical protein
VLAPSHNTWQLTYNSLKLVCLQILKRKRSPSGQIGQIPILSSYSLVPFHYLRDGT